MGSAARCAARGGRCTTPCRCAARARCARPCGGRPSTPTRPARSKPSLASAIASVLGVGDTDAQHRPGDLLAHDAHRPVGAGDDDRVDERAGPLAAGAAAADDRAVGRRLGQQQVDALQPVVGDERADVGAVVVRVADAQAARGGHHALDERLGDRAHDDGALDVAAALAGVGERSPHGAGDRAVEVGVVEDEHRVLAAGLQDGAAQRPCARLADLAPGAQRAGEAHLGDRRLDERAAGVGVPLHDAQQPFRDAGAGEQPADALAGQAGVRRGLEDDAVAGHQRDGDVSERCGEGLRGRAEHGDDAERLVAPARPLAGEQEARDARMLAAQDARPLLGEPLQGVDGRQDLLGERLRARAALLVADEVGQLVELGDDRLGDERHVVRPVLETQARPQPLDERRPVDGRQDLRIAARRDRPDRLAGGRADGVEHRPDHGRPRARRIASRRSRSAVSRSPGS